VKLLETGRLILADLTKFTPKCFVIASVSCCSVTSRLRFLIVFLYIYIYMYVCIHIVMLFISDKITYFHENVVAVSQVFAVCCQLTLCLAPVAVGKEEVT
jgi:hypothetical protein